MAPCLLEGCTTIDQLHTYRYAVVSCGAPVRDESRRVIVAMWIFFSFSFTSVILRFVSRALSLGGSLGWDDWTILILLAIIIPLNITIHYSTRFGFGHDIWMLEEYQIVAIFKVVPLFAIRHFSSTELTSLAVSTISWTRLYTTLRSTS